MHVKKKQKMFWPALWRNAWSLICNSSQSLLCGSPVEGLPAGDWWPWHLSHSLRTPANPLFSLLDFRLSCPHRPCPFSLAVGIVIGVADSCLPGCLKLPSCALCRCSTSQHYCSCWAFFLKSFPAVSWYGKPLKLAPDCSVYFVLDKRQNTVPAASQEEGGRGEDGDQGTQARSFPKKWSPRQNHERHKCVAVPGPVFYVTQMGWLSNNFRCEHTSIQKRKSRPQYEVTLGGS